MTKFGTNILQRLPLYLRTLQQLQREGHAYASGAQLAVTLGFESIVVRKDLARTGVRGTPRLGFPIDRLIPAIECLIGADDEKVAVLAGVGKLGSALLSYPGFRKQGIMIAAGFDAAPERCNLILSGTPIFSVSTLTETVSRLNATLGKSSRKRHPCVIIEHRVMIALILLLLCFSHFTCIPMVIGIVRPVRRHAQIDPRGDRAVFRV